MKRRTFLKMFALPAIPTSLLFAGDPASSFIDTVLDDSVAYRGGTGYVSSLSSGIGDGSSWNNAFKSINDAMASRTKDGVCNGQTFYVSKKQKLIQIK